MTDQPGEFTVILAVNLRISAWITLPAESQEQADRMALAEYHRIADHGMSIGGARLGLPEQSPYAEATIPGRRNVRSRPRGTLAGQGKVESDGRFSWQP